MNNKRKFEELTEIEKMVLALKGAIEEIKRDKTKELFYSAFIVATMERLKGKGMTKEDIYNYKVEL